MITLDELDAELASERRSDEGLSGAADAHHHVEPGMHSGLSYTVEPFGAILLANETLKGAATMRLAMIGLGRMGGNMVQRLLQGGHEVIVYDRSADAIEAHVAKGAT